MDIPRVPLINKCSGSREKLEDGYFFKACVFTVIGILCSGLFFAFVSVGDAHLSMLPRFFQGLLVGIGTVFTFLFLSMSLCYPYSIGTRVKVWLTIIGFTVGAPLFVSTMAFSFPSIPTYDDNLLAAVLGFGLGGLAVIPLLD